LSESFAQLKNKHSTRVAFKTRKAFPRRSY